MKPSDALKEKIDKFVEGLPETIEADFDQEREPETEDEFETIVLKFENLPAAAMANIEGKITSMLTDGWDLMREIICAPYAVLVFCRQKEFDNE